MGIHADDLVRAIRHTLAEGIPDMYGEICPTQSEVRITSNLEQYWPNRDGRIEFDCIGRDWFRAFRVTVEAMPVDEFRGDHGGPDWRLSAE